MKKFASTVVCLIVLFLCFDQIRAQKKFDIENSAILKSIIEESIAESIENFKYENFKREEVAVSLIDLKDAGNLQKGSFNGNLKMYPASVVKIFYLVAAHRQMEEGKLKTSPELERGLRDMIVESSNDATHFIVDVLTGTSGGAELLGKELENYAFKRNAVNRYFQTLGFESINVNQKTYCEDLYGRERQFWDEGKNRNMLTTDATARLFAEIALRKAVSFERSGKMLELLNRNPSKKTDEPGEESPAKIITALKNTEGVKVWSKAGWTSTILHDAAYIETPDGQKFVLVIFTQNHAQNLEFLPAIAEKIISKLRKK